MHWNDLASVCSLHKKKCLQYASKEIYEIDLVEFRPNTNHIMSV